jgi:hypothetical protein
MPIVDLRDFGGGLNLRDSLEQLPLNETPDALNMTLTPRGAARVRYGCIQTVTLPTGAGENNFLFYSAVLDKWFHQAGDSLYVRPGDFSGSWELHINPLPGGSNNIVAMCDFGQVAVVCQLGGGVWTTDGTTATLRTATIGGNAIAVFKNRVWVSGGQASVFFSALGDAATWNPVTDFVIIREKDAEFVTAFGGNIGGGLLVFKRTSAYRITDASTGAYNTLDWNTGCVGPGAVATVRGLAYTWGRDSIYAWDGINRGVSVADKIRPRFLANSATEFSFGRVRAGALEGRVIFAYPFNDSYNNRLIELLPLPRDRTDELPAAGWVVEHQLAQPSQDAVTWLAQKGNKLYATIADAEVMFSVFDQTAVGDDNGVPYTSYIRTAHVTLGLLARLQRVRAYGSALPAGTNTKEIRTYKDWQIAPSYTFDVTAGFETGNREEVADLRALGHAEAHQLEFRVHSGVGIAEMHRLRLELTELER